MRIIDTFARKVREIPHVAVPMPDGCHLAARIFMPEGAEAAPVPAILEYIPYRKNDLCAPEDEMTGRYYAGHGYAYVRLDLRGTGDSEGVMRDEYLPQELQDGVDAIAWIAAQDWCDGNIGMIGISWGGFNGLQIAALRPPALKAIVTICSTDDRYADDVHYMGGCLLLDNLSWASQMFARNTLPPDPRHRGEAWREDWLLRLRESGLWLKNWLQHQTRDDFWKHGSVCEDFLAIEIPVYAVSGWADGYCRSVFRLMENLSGPRKGLVGPWAHKRPHVGAPGPAIGFLQETLRWWDEWLRGETTGIMDEPMLRLFMQDHAPPQASYEARAGRWVAEPSWPSPNVRQTPFFLGEDGSLGRERGEARAALSVASPFDLGMAAGKWCSYAHPGDQPIDQRVEPDGSLTFCTEPLAEAMEIAGDASVFLAFAVDRPVASVAARLIDVAPDGAETRVSFGVFNLTHRDSHETPAALEPGRRYEVRVPMKSVAQRFRAGHRIRLALSTAYFPMIWPSPEPVTLTVFTGESALHLPCRTSSPQDESAPAFGEPETGEGPRIEVIEPADLYWRVTRDLVTGRVRADVGDGAGVYRLVDDDITILKKARERYSVDPDDPLSAEGSTEWEIGVSRGDWRVRSRTETTLCATRTAFLVKARLRAWEGDELVHDMHWNEEVPRNLV